jgi:hypothetical protein
VAGTDRAIGFTRQLHCVVCVKCVMSHIHYTVGWGEGNNLSIHVALNVSVNLFHTETLPSYG